MPLSGALLFFLSLAGLIAVCWSIARMLASRPDDRLWIALGAGAMLLGAISLGASMVRLYTPAGFIGAQILLSLIALACARAAASRPGLRVGDEAPQSSPGRIRPTELALLITIVLMVTLSAVERAVTPLHNVDELMYHASRAVYWIQNQSVFPYETHNDRQTTFPFGAELIFAWPLLFTGADFPGRMLHWLAVPLATWGVFSVARAAGAARPAALFAALLYIATPAVLFRAAQLKGDIWTPVFALGAGCWVARAAARPGEAMPRLFWAGAMTALAMNVKVTVGAMVPALAIAPLLMLPFRRGVRGVLAIGAGGLAAALLGGLATLFIANTADHRHPLGPDYMRAEVQPDFSLRQTWTHIVRVPVYLAELPDVPSQTVRRRIEELRQDVLDDLGAGEPLPMEDESNWPGVARTTVNATRFALGGLLWLPLLGAGVVILLREAIRTFPRIRLSPLSLLILIQTPMLLGPVFLIRWMGGGPERFWLAAYALSLATGLAILSRWERARSALATLAIIGACAAAYPATRQMIARIDQRSSGNIFPPFRFAPALAHIPPGSAILLVGRINAQDYPLMAPKGRIINRVTTWGKRPFDPDRLGAMLESQRIDFVLLERDRMLWHGEPPPMDAGVMVAWLLDQPWASEIPLDTDQPMRLFAIEPR